MNSLNSFWISSVERLRQNRHRNGLYPFLHFLKPLYYSLTHRVERNFCISFPKSGRTWLRLVIAGYLAKHFSLPLVLDLSGLIHLFGRQWREKGVPTLGFSHAGYEAETSDDIEKEIKRFYGKRVLFLARNPGDVCVSFYWHHRYRRKVLDKDFKKNMGLSEFLRHRRLGIQRIIEFQNLWFAHRSFFEDFMLVRYRDFHESPFETFSSILRFLGIQSIREDLLQEVITDCAFENMKKMERLGVFKDPMLKSENTDSDEHCKVRRGVVGGYKMDLTEDDIVFAEQAMRSVNPELRIVTEKY